MTFVAMQLAYHMGFSEIALVGCDHYFKEHGQPHETLHANKADPNHFDPDYFSDQYWHSPDLKMSEKSYLQARKAFEASGRRIFNASTKTNLEIFPRIQLEKFWRIKKPLHMPAKKVCSICIFKKGTVR